MNQATKPRRAHNPGGTSKHDAVGRSDSRPVNLEDTASALQSASLVKAESKTIRVITLLQRQNGASLAELVAETGWQPHTTRAALTGLRKKGHSISSDKVDGVRRYKAGAQR